MVAFGSIPYNRELVIATDPIVRTVPAVI